MVLIINHLANRFGNKAILKGGMTDKVAIGSLMGVNTAEKYEKVISSCSSAAQGECEKVLQAL